GARQSGRLGGPERGRTGAAQCGAGRTRGRGRPLAALPHPEQPRTERRPGRRDAHRDLRRAPGGRRRHRGCRQRPWPPPPAPRAAGGRARVRPVRRFDRAGGVRPRPGDRRGAGPRPWRQCPPAAQHERGHRLRRRAAAAGSCAKPASALISCPPFPPSIPAMRPAMTDDSHSGNEITGSYVLCGAVGLMGLVGLFVAARAGHGLGYYGGLTFFAFAVLFIFLMIKHGFDKAEGLVSGGLPVWLRLAIAVGLGFLIYNGAEDALPDKAGLAAVVAAVVIFAL